MDFINTIIGLHVKELSCLQMLCRGFIAFFAGLAFIRMAGQRTLGTQSAFDQLTLLILGAILGRAVVSAEQPFFPSLLAVLLIVLLHRLLAYVTFKSRAMGKVLKGQDILLIKNGELQRDKMQATCTTADDLNQAARLTGNINKLEHVAEARLERSGEISIVKH